MSQFMGVPGPSKDEFISLSNQMENLTPLAGLASLQEASNLNTLYESMQIRSAKFNWYQASATGSPDANYGGIVFTYAYSGTYVSQLALCDGGLFRRNKSGSGWGSWTNIG